MNWPHPTWQAFYAAVQQAGGDVDGSESVAAAGADGAAAWPVLPDVQVEGQPAYSAADGFAAEAPAFAEPAGTADPAATYAQQLSAYEEPVAGDAGAALTQPIPYAESMYSQSAYSYAESGYAKTASTPAECDRKLSMGRSGARGLVLAIGAALELDCVTGEPSLAGAHAHVLCCIRFCRAIPRWTAS